MKRTVGHLLALLPALLLFSCFSPPAGPPPTTGGPLILVSIDGFRWDYLQIHDAPTLRKLAREGVHARRMTPSFPSLTFPNHYTLVTGLRPEHHGIVGNSFRDPVLEANFNYKNDETVGESRWWGGEPIWVTAERQGVRSACFFWPGSVAAIDGVRPSYYRHPYAKSMTSAERVDGVLEWLALPADRRPRFCTLYFDLVDVCGHEFGPEAPETGAAVREVDAAVARLLEGLTRLGQREATSLVIVSDHGMEPVSPDRTILLDDYVSLNDVEVDFAGPVAALRPKQGTAEELAAKFRGRHPQLTVWRRDEVPERLHYRASDRIAPVILNAAAGWSVTSRDYLRVRRATWERGAHGFDPALPGMGAFFVAGGPAFRRRVEFPEVENIHVYNLLCAALGVAPAPNDGDDRLVRIARGPAGVGRTR